MATDFPDLYMLSPILGVLILIFLILLMIYFYAKTRVWTIILIIYLFSLIIGVSSLEEGNIPYTPYFQLFFILVQTMFFTLTSFDLYNKVKK